MRAHTLKQASSSSSKPGHFGQLFQTVSPGGSSSQLKALCYAALNATEEQLKQIDFIMDFIAWIYNSNFLRSQQQELLVGDANCPLTVAQGGIRGQSVYTALFDHVDMQIFSCKLCPHIVKDDLEGAITHQRHHFRHRPFQCSGTQARWYVSISPVYESVLRIFSIQRTALRKPSRSGGTPAHYWALIQGSEMSCDLGGPCQDADLRGISIGVTFNYYLCLMYALYSSQTPFIFLGLDWFLLKLSMGPKYNSSCNLFLWNKSYLSNTMFRTGLRALHLRPSHSLFYGSCIDARSLVDPTEKGTLELHKSTGSRTTPMNCRRPY